MEVRLKNRIWSFADRWDSPTAGQRQSRFFSLSQASGLEGIHLHSARHTHATLMLKQGVHPRVVQERLGHANISVTLDVYSHVMPGMQEMAARAFDKFDPVTEVEKSTVEH